MRKTVLILLLAAMSTSAMAEWVRLWGNELQGSYANPDSIRMNGKKVVTQNMFDLKIPSEYLGNEFRSMVMVYEFDCAKERARALESIWYAESKGEGAIVDSWSSPDTWKVVFPATPLHSFMTYACGKNQLN